MYLNVITLKSGRTVPFTTELPYSVDKIVPGWNIVVDEPNGAIISFIGDEVAVVGNQDLDKAPKVKPQPKPRKNPKYFKLEK